MVIEIQNAGDVSGKLRFNVDINDELVYLAIVHGDTVHSVEVELTELVAAVEAIKHLIKK